MAGREEVMHDMNQQDFFNIRQKLIKDAVVGVKRVVEGIVPTYKNPLLSASDIEELLEQEYGTKDKVTDESNGWQCDMWSHYHLANGIYLTIEGCGFYGGITVYINTKPEEDFR